MLQDGWRGCGANRREALTRNQRANCALHLPRVTAERIHVDRIELGQAGVELRAELVRWEFHPRTLPTPLVGDRTCSADHRDHAGNSEDLRPTHDGVR